MIDNIRFAHLDMERYKREMSEEDYNFFVAFVGVDSFGFTEDDFDF